MDWLHTIPQLERKKRNRRWAPSSRRQTEWDHVAQARRDSLNAVRPGNDYLHRLFVDGWQALFDPTSAS
jgi:hypothetical protein